MNTTFAEAKATAKEKLTVSKAKFEHTDDEMRKTYAEQEDVGFPTLFQFFEVLLTTMTFDVALQRHHEREDPERVGRA